jgi:tRNA threonylcarbamoyl adenosine modification protein (Sua5/YciO/YrdC/YwlC family)
MVSDLEACGRRLREGGLVAFPTETVYGLGCHALDATAVLKVFVAKERPLSDPLIVHVLGPSEAFELWDAPPASARRAVLDELSRAFWPGPLTLVAPAVSSKVPPCVTAGTGFVACRSPSHAAARELLRHSGVPLGAPSANKFGHVSPTTALHVYDDLRLEDVWIVPDDKDGGGAGAGKGGCDVGVESTVAKIVEEEATTNGNGGPERQTVRVQILRQGKVSEQDVRDCLRRANLLPLVAVETVRRVIDEHEASVAPGQTLRHYSPNVPSFLVAPSALHRHHNLLPPPGDNDNGDKLRDSAVVDYGGRLAGWSGAAGAYRDLSPSGDPAAAARLLFEALRWAERLPVSRILFPSLEECAGAQEEGDALLLAVRDRLTRAASGVVIASLDEL